MKNLIRQLVFITPVGLFLSACGSAPVENKNTPAKSPTPIAASPEKIDRAANVSFSTYSKEWPVGWQWIDPDEKHNPTPHDVKSGVLRIRIPSQKDLYGENRTAPRYLKAITGDFQIETRVKFLPKENYQGAGLIILKDDDNYIRFERAYGGVGGGAEGIRIDVRKGEEYRPLVTPEDIQTDAGEVDMKIVRKGNLFTAFWRLDENAEWREASEFESDYPDTILAGLVACNTAREVTAEFAYIRLLPVPQH
ncbi:MAG: DUF1349 domain-containing protein [Pyrinomonadaceae bacterium]